MNQSMNQSINQSINEGPSECLFYLSNIIYIRMIVSAFFKLIELRENIFLVYTCKARLQTLNQCM